MRRQPLCIHYLHQFLNKPNRETSRSRLFLNKHKRIADTHSSPHASSSNEPSHLVTDDMPTPDVCLDRTGYAYSAVTLGSNPLYNYTSWTVSTETNKDKESSTLDSREEREVSVECDSRGLGESEVVVVDLKLTSSTELERRERPKKLWLPSIRDSPQHQFLHLADQRSPEWIDP